MFADDSLCAHCLRFYAVHKNTLSDHFPWQQITSGSCELCRLDYSRWTLLVQWGSSDSQMEPSNQRDNTCCQIARRHLPPWPSLVSQSCRRQETESGRDIRPYQQWWYVFIFLKKNWYQPTKWRCLFFLFCFFLIKIFCSHDVCFKSILDMYAPNIDTELWHVMCGHKLMAL